MSMADPKLRPKKEQEWADRDPDPDEEQEEREPVYRDGSVQHECWAADDDR